MEMSNSKKTRKLRKVRKVMHEFKSGSLKSSSGEKVSDPKQAIAIALSEAGMSRHGEDSSSERGAMGDKPMKKSSKTKKKPMRTPERDF